MHGWVGNGVAPWSRSGRGGEGGGGGRRGIYRWSFRFFGADAAHQRRGRTATFPVADASRRGKKGLRSSRARHSRHRTVVASGEHNLLSNPGSKFRLP